MEVSFSPHAPAEVGADLLVLPASAAPGLGIEIQLAGFAGRPGEELLLPRRAGDPFHAGAVLLVGLEPDADERAVRRAVGHAAPRMADFATVAVALPHPGAVVEGVRLGGYRFDRYKSAPESRAVERLLLLGPEDAEAVARAEVVAEAVTFTRDLVNTPAGDLVPMTLARRAVEMAEEAGLDARVLAADELREGGFGGILGVGAASANPPCLIEVSYPGDGKSGVVGLAGKGITFDAGGLGIKSLKAMSTMKSDMAGGATMLAVVRAAARLGLPTGVVAVVPAAENMVSGSATRPGDVLRHRNGVTTEVADTDAEGRLVLADALAYLAERRPDAIIDVATLTYSVMHALGEDITGVLGNDRALLGALTAAGEAQGEPLWEMPLWRPYLERIRSDVADFKNDGGEHADVILAALFLENFAGGVPWAHLDFAATAYLDRATDLGPVGATGAMVRTLISYLESR
ncbi:leucyl aminopeptidase [Microbispora sp. NBRC 16548]|uniref:leucyl aminopeptidase n=1 Tax=Microbispora sp. NBRC 16548 TaxID=3030994 RepID=UPI0024A07F61|nr:leucyl aminopeptidase [Microbispora sp. NBRC 16548]GLX05868.1 putative cytosol aminopeptidase [Microbispora sp. NBRC 16548]